jgi:predicted dinucleotide-binding enzyme
MEIGIIGAGMIGSTLAKLWVSAGHEVRLASRHPEHLQPLVAKLGKRASAGTPDEAANFGEVVLLTVPLKSRPGPGPRSCTVTHWQGSARYRQCVRAA